MSHLQPFLTTLIAAVILMIGIHCGLRRWLNVSLLSVGDALNLVTGMGAKLACSAYFISGFDPVKIRRDLQTYSPAYRFLSLKYSQSTVQADIAGALRRTARFIPARGSLLDPRHTTPQSLLQAKTTSTRTSWHPSELCTDNHLQQIANDIKAQDSEAGFDTRALLVVKDGKLVAESYAAGITQDTKLLGWSMSKSLTSILFGCMEQLGLANPHSNQLFPEWRNDARCEITLEQLLQMRSGLRFNESYVPGSDVTRMLFTDPNCWQRALNSPLIHAPGTHFDYASGTTNLLTRWMQLRLGGARPCLAFLYRELLEPLGMSNTLLEVDSSGALVGSSYAYASGRDWARLATLLLNRGHHADRQIVSDDWVTRALSPNPSNNEKRYGYQIWLNSGSQHPPRYKNLPPDACFMLGNHEQKIMLVPSLNTAVVRLGWCAAEYPIEKRFSQFL